MKSTAKLMAEGEEIYKRGIETGVTSGKVIDINFNPSKSITSGDIKLTNAVLTNCVADVGDSGGIVAGGGTTSSRYVVGIISCGGTRTSQLTGYTERIMAYSKAPSILKTLNLTLY